MTTIQSMCQRKTFRKVSSIVWCLFAAAAISGCAASLPSSGFSSRQVRAISQEPTKTGIKVIDLDSSLAQRLLECRKLSLFSEVFGADRREGHLIGPGDSVEVSIWEAPPSTLFGAVPADLSAASATVKGTTVPEQMVGGDGLITVPFAGRIRASERTPRQIEEAVTKRLYGIAHQPQVLVRLVRNTTSNVTIVGEVPASQRMPLTPRGERLLDALAAAGGVRQPVEKVMLLMTRGDVSNALPLETIIRDPKQNITLAPGDVITVLYQPQSFTVLGATGKNDEVNFDAQGISLVQALGRAGGLQDSRADAQGVFIFRFESADCLTCLTDPALSGKMPVIYRANLKDPATFFAAQKFPINDKDLLYVSNASLAEFQKFLSIIMSVAYPALSATAAIQAVK